MTKTRNAPGCSCLCYDPWTVIRVDERCPKHGLMAHLHRPELYPDFNGLGVQNWIVRQWRTGADYGWVTLASCPTKEAAKAALRLLRDA